MPGNIDITNGGAGTVVPTLISDITGLDTQLTNLSTKNDSQDDEIQDVNAQVNINSADISTINDKVVAVENQSETNRQSIVSIGEFVKNDGVPYTGITDVPIGTTGTKGIVQVDGVTIKASNGVLSADIAAAEKRAVSSEATMLALPLIENLYIVTRTDIDRLYYLNAGEDPAVLTNWVEGAHTGDIVASFNGRTGAVVPEIGDYAVGDINGLTLALNSKQDELSATNRLSANAIGDGSVSNTELSYLGNVTSDIQTQIDSITEFDESLVYGQVGTKSVDVYTQGDVQSAVIEGLDSDQGLSDNPNTTLSINVGESNDFALKDGASEILRFDADADHVFVGKSLRTKVIYPDGHGNRDLGTQANPWDEVYFQKLTFVPSSTTASLVVPLCIGMIKITSDATVEYRSSAALTVSRDTSESTIGAYTVSIDGAVKTALDNASSYWYTASGWDGDNVYTTNSWSTSGCGVYTRDMPNLTFQNTGVIVQIWVHDPSI